MRDGYRLERSGPDDAEYLIGPKGERVVRVDYETNVPFITLHSCVKGIAERSVRDISTLGEVLQEIGAEHYQLATTRQDRFHDRRKKFLADPIWGWLAFLLAVVVAAVGWMS